MLKTCLLKALQATKIGAPAKESARLQRASSYYNWAYTYKWVIYEVSLNGVPEF